MQVTVGFTVSSADMERLKKQANGNVSEKIRNILATMDIDKVLARAKTMRTTCKIDIGTAQRLEELAEQSGSLPPQLVRAAVEAYIHESLWNENEPDQQP